MKLKKGDIIYFTNFPSDDEMDRYHINEGLAQHNYGRKAVIRFRDSVLSNMIHVRFIATGDTHMLPERCFTKSRSNSIFTKRKNKVS